MTKINQAHPLWSEPDCIRFSCHVSPELLVTSAVKSPLVRRKVRPWAMAASIWGSWARVANGNNDIGGLTAIKTKMAEEIPVHKNTNML